jgi:hypothetical protein
VACFHPLKAFRTACGEIIFNPHRRDTVADLTLPCGQCVGCRLERSRQWAIRCVHEASLHKDNCFITLTYAPEHLPFDNSLHYRDFQLFMKRLRKRFPDSKIRFYMCGEYGENFGRPHFHACLFGWNFPDRKLFFTSKHGDKVYRSDTLEELWPFGLCSIGEVTFKSAAYVARYIMKKVTGKAAYAHYHEIDIDGVSRETPRTPEFTKMSLKPGIGAGWFDKYKDDVYPHDYVIVNGKKVKPPRYYDKKYAESDPFDYDELEFHRFSRAREKLHDNTPERLAVRKEVLEAKLSKLKRNLV